MSVNISLLYAQLYKQLRSHPSFAGLVGAVSFGVLGVVFLGVSQAVAPVDIGQGQVGGVAGGSGSAVVTPTRPTSKSSAAVNKPATTPTKTAAGSTAAVDVPASVPSQSPSLPDPGTYNVTVNFATAVAQVDAYALSGTVSGYGTAWSSQCSNAPCATMKRLGLGMYRVSIQWNNGNPVSGAGGNGTGGTPGDQMVDAIRAAGAEPVIVVGGKGGQNDMDFSVADAQELVTHYTSGKYAGAGAVTYFVVGNEPNNSGNGAMTVAQYCTKFNSSAVAMRQANAGVKLIGPAWSYYDLNSIKQFLQCAGSQVDVVDYHAYGQSSQGIGQNIQSSAAVYEQQNRDVRTAINSLVPSRAGQISQEVGEYNVSPFASSQTADDRFYTAGSTVWNAIATGSILQGGGRAFIYADQNNPLGLIFQTSAIAGIYGRSAGDPQPAYHGVGMFTGEGRFRHFGSSMVQTASTDADIIGYASTNAKSVVLINRNSSAVKAANVRLNGVSHATATMWQTDKNRAFDDPVDKGSFAVGAGLTYDLPPYSVTTVLLD